MQASNQDFCVVVGENRVTLLHHGHRCFEQMLFAIAQAKQEILLEMYWFASDVIGLQIEEALCERARRGVEVKVIVDAIGSLETDEGMFERMREAGCRVRVYNPITFFRNRLWRKRLQLTLNNRDHRKILVVDEAFAMTGGVNIAAPWLDVADGGEGWRDDMVFMQGASAYGLKQVFVSTWERIDPEVMTTPLAYLKARYTRADVYAAGAIRIMASEYRRQRSHVLRWYLQQIGQARDYIYISSSYFLPDRSLVRALSEAVDRGVDVRVMTAATSDVMAVYFASRQCFSRLLKAGVKIYLWQPSVLHAKTAVIDDQHMTLGTYNLDYRSWLHNLEVNIGIDNPDIARAMRAQFERDIAQSAELQQQHWQYRPLGQRLLEAFFYLFRWLL